MTKKIIVIKFGGSIFSTSEDKIFNFDKVVSLRTLLRKFYDLYQFVVVVGGGYIARKYISLLDNNKHYIENNLEDKKHEVGVASININAVLFQSLFTSDEVEDFIPRYNDFDLDDKLHFSKNVMVSAAGHPGHSSDYNAFKLALRVGSDLVVSLKDINGVYSKDPKKYNDAVKLDNITWDQYLNIIGDVAFRAGGNFPVDPVTAKKAMLSSKVKFLIIQGDDNFDNLEKYLLDSTHNGTLIS